MLQQDDIYSVRGEEVGGAAADAAAAAVNAILPGAGALVSVIGPWIDKAARAVASFFTGESYDAHADFASYLVRESRATPPEGADTRTKQAMAMALGIVGVYCSDSVGTRDAILREFAARGWRGYGPTGGKWWQRYAKGGGQYTHWYGAVFSLADCPRAALDRKRAAVGTNFEAELIKTVEYLFSGKRMTLRQYGGTEDWNALFNLAIPILPPTPEARETPPAADTRQFQRPTAPPVGPPPAVAPPPPAVAPPAPPQPYDSPVLFERLMSLVESLALRRAARIGGSRGVDDIL